MASEKQISANRRNAKKSTGPRTEQGKLRSRQNAFRHGLTAETVISIIENADEYTEFERLIIEDYEPRTSIERALVVRLASLLWRLRRTVAIETGFFQAQGQIIHNRRRLNQHEMTKDPLRPFRDILKRNKPEQAQSNLIVPDIDDHTKNGQTTEPARPPTLSQCFFRLANLDGSILERIDRYEVRLWRQTAQIVLILNSFHKLW